MYKVLDLKVYTSNGVQSFEVAIGKLQLYRCLNWILVLMKLLYIYVYILGLATFFGSY